MKQRRARAEVQRHQIAAQLRGIAERLEDGTYTSDDLCLITNFLPDLSLVIEARPAQ